jgi:phenylpropionate dioxygenase-like ring-hydroxylating dioxygenase large terminal subunit
VRCNKGFVLGNCFRREEHIVSTHPIESVLFDDWHVVADNAWVQEGSSAYRTRLFNIPLEVTRAGDGSCAVRRLDSGPTPAVAVKYGFVWACLGTPRQDVIHVPEADETDRFVLTSGSIGVAVSGLRAVENFLDMGHFPFVHDGWLGAEPHTEVLPYDVAANDEEIVATNCKFFQPLASPASPDGSMVDYVYKVPRPYMAVLYKSNPLYPGRMDYIGLFVQPVDEENCIAHMLVCYIKEGMTPTILRWFIQLIFAQDKPILENQYPKRLPLNPRAETPIQADRMSIAYRRWLINRGVSYGAVPADAH